MPRGGGGFGGRFLIFNSLMLCSGFAVNEKSLIFNALLTSSKCLSLNDFTHLYGVGRGVKQGIRWFGLVFGLVLSKGAKVWCSVWVLGGAKQVCKARVLSKVKAVRVYI